MNFMHAMNALKKGHKVRKKSYGAGSFLFLKGNLVWAEKHYIYPECEVVREEHQFGIDDFSYCDWELLPTFHKFETALKSYHKGNIIYYHEDNVPYPVKFCKKVTGACVDISNCVVRNMYDEKVESYMFAPKRILSNRWVIEGN
jgi:hypothetical protein